MMPMLPSVPPKPEAILAEMSLNAIFEQSPITMEPSSKERKGCTLNTTMVISTKRIATAKDPNNQPREAVIQVTSFVMASIQSLYPIPSSGRLSMYVISELSENLFLFNRTALEIYELQHFGARIETEIALLSRDKLHSDWRIEGVATSTFLSARPIPIIKNGVNVRCRRVSIEPQKNGCIF